MANTNKSLDEQFEDYLAERNAKKLILHNDEINTFAHVQYCLIKLCGHEPIQADQCSLLVHHKGRCHIKTGSEDQMNSLKSELEENDLTVTVE